MTNKLKELRKEKGLTLDSISELTGIKRGTYNNYENGKTEPKLSTWQKLADFFNVRVDFVQGVSPYRTNQDAFEAFISQQDRKDRNIRKPLDLKELEPVLAMEETYFDDIFNVLQSLNLSKGYAHYQNLTIEQKRAIAYHFDTVLGYANILAESSSKVADQYITDLINTDNKYDEQIQKIYKTSEQKKINDDDAYANDK